MDLEKLLAKYWDIIKEEVNVKEIVPFPAQVSIKKVIKPIGSVISKKYGKDTWNIIKLAKSWAWEMVDSRVFVLGENWVKWELLPGEYEISWEGVEGDQMWAEDNVVVKLDTTITPQLYEEWIAREISRFLNQMRKEAWYDVSDRVFLSVEGSSKLEDIVFKYKDFLSTEALLRDVKRGIPHEFDIYQLFEADNWEKIKFYLKK